MEIDNWNRGVLVEDVKEAVRRLKKKKMVGREVIQISMQEFDKLMGNKLI